MGRRIQSAECWCVLSPWDNLSWWRHFSTLKKRMRNRFYMRSISRNKINRCGIIRSRRTKPPTLSGYRIRPAGSGPSKIYISQRFWALSMLITYLMDLIKVYETAFTSIRVNRASPRWSSYKYKANWFTWQSVFSESLLRFLHVVTVTPPK